VRYRLLEQPAGAATGTGMTVNFSRSGVQFTTSQQLPVGSAIEISVDWPADLAGQCALQFVATGRVIRSEANLAAVRIYQHEFRTRGRLGARQPQAPAGPAQPRL
jgi:hypothetical protein